MLHPMDRKVRDQAIRRHREKEFRQKRQIPVPNGPGWTSVGSIFDCSRVEFEKKLKSYFSDLYVGWNPLKRDGLGCWEIWQKPSKLTAVKQGNFGDGILYLLELCPNDFEHHVYDLPYLTYAFIDKLREMDMWENKQFLEQMDENDDIEYERQEKKEADAIKYAVRHNKSLFKKLKELAQDGYNPFWFFSDKRQGNGQV